MTVRLSWEHVRGPRHADVSDDETAAQVAEALAAKGTKTVIWYPADLEPLDEAEAGEVVRGRWERWLKRKKARGEGREAG